MNNMAGYVSLSRISSVIFRMVLKVWAYSGIVLVFCFLLYYMYGGIVAILLLLFSITGLGLLNL